MPAIQTPRESELIASLREGNQNALGELYDQYGSALFGVVLRIVQSQEQAEDVLQEVFVKIWKNIASYDEAKGK
ncbi:MAG: sigma factor, partial [Bacteroidota bacterium]